MRIGMLADVYKPHISGITNYIDLSKRNLESLGEEVFIFTFGDQDYIDDEKNVIRSSGVPLLDTGYYFSLRYNSQARKLLRTMDVVHIHHPFISGTIGQRFCQPRGIPIVFTNHTRYDLYAQAYLPGVPEVVGYRALQTFLPAFCRSCDLVVAPSSGMRNVLIDFGVDVNIDVVPNGVDLQPFKNPIEPLDRLDLGFDKDDVLFIYVGRLGPEKNLPFLLRAVAGTVQAYPNVRLVLVGSGSEMDNLKDRVKHMDLVDHVFFVGSVDYKDVPRYLVMADVFVSASITEVHPLSVIEAMAAGLPVLGMISPGVGDTVQDWETGYLVEKDDLSGFTAKMVRLVVDTKSRREMGNKAQKASDVYSIQRTTQLILERYRNVIEKTANRKSGMRSRVIRWLDNFR